MRFYSSAYIPSAAAHCFGSGRAMAEEGEAIYVVATDGEMFYGLRLIATLAVKTRIASRDMTDPLFEETGTQIKF